MLNAPAPDPHKSLVFFLIAGEASGDILGARLMQALRAGLGGKVRFIGIGGPLMQAQGIELLFPHTELMHFGLIEVVRHLPRLLKLIGQTADEIIRVNPNALITIDAPDFCFRVGRKIKKRSGTKMPLIHYVAPTVWVWRPGRARKVARFLDQLLTLLPFEPPYFMREGLDCAFAGHPIVESGADKGSNASFRAARGIDPQTPLLAVLPGSRVSEVTRLLPIFRAAVQLLRAKHPDLQLVVPTVAHLKNEVAAEIAGWDIKAHIVEGERDKYDAFAACRVSLAASGTVALELALAKLPGVIAYKVKAPPSFLWRPFIRVPFANLVNIMHGKKVVPEFLQERCTAENLANAVDLLLSDENARQTQIAALASTASWLGQGQFIPSHRAADIVMETLAKNKLPAVLQVLPALVTGGVERGTVEMTAALAQNGFRAYVASAGGPMVAEIEAAGGIHIPLPLASKNPLTVFANIGRLTHVIRQHHISIVHARSRAPAWSAFFAGRRAQIPFVTTFHSAYGAGSRLKRWYNSAMAKGARVIAISGFVAAYAEKTYAVSHDIMRVIHRGVDIAAFDRDKVDAERVSALRRDWNLTANAPVILMPARLTRWKGQSLLIQALTRLTRRDFICVIVGGGRDTPYGRELAQEIKQAGLEKNIVLRDTCRDMPAAYLLADMVIVPSLRPEGFGRVVIEAQAMGTPVIASDHGGAAETVIASETGWLVTPGDAEALARAIDKVLNLPAQQRDYMAHRAIFHIRENFTAAQMTAKTLAVYRELMKGKSNA